MSLNDFMDTEEGGIPWRLAFPEFACNEKRASFKDTRLLEELSQKLLFEKTGIQQRHISEMETGKRKVGRKWAKILEGHSVRPLV